MKSRITLFGRILFWQVLTLLLFGALFFAFFGMPFALGRLSPLHALFEDRMGRAARLFSFDLSRSPREDWDGILARYSETFDVQYALFDGSGKQLAGATIEPLPQELLDTIAERREQLPEFLFSGERPERRGFRGRGNPSRRRGPPEFPRRGDSANGPPGTEGPPRFGPGSPPHRPTGLRFTVRTSSPTRYWGGVFIPVMRGPGEPPTMLVLLALSDSRSGTGLFLNPIPWVLLLVGVVAVSAVLWLPMVRSITRPIGRVTRATEQIARGHFNIMLDEERGDEIGRLGKAINDMSARLSRMVGGQKRFLGDVAHELTSPLARIQVGLGIVERQLSEMGGDPGSLQEVIDEARQMSDLVQELLSFSRAEVTPERIRLLKVPLAESVRRVVERERQEGVEFRIDVDETLEAIADPQLLARALANLIRNAIRYAGDSGPVEISASRSAGRRLRLEIRDHGSGVPEHQLSELFEPFYRPEASRRSETGGVGLGLAIVKSCVEACQGSVSAANVEPRGFRVTLTLDAA